MPPFEGIASNGEVSASNFYIAVKSADDELVDTATNVDEVNITARIAPQPEHIGQQADVFLVDSLDNGFIMKTADGRFIPWNGEAGDLEPALQGVVLDEGIDLSVHAGAIDYVGDHNLYLAYRLEGDSNLFYNGAAASLKITPAGVEEDAANAEVLVTGSALTMSDAPELNASALLSGTQVKRNTWGLYSGPYYKSSHSTEATCLAAAKALATTEARTYNCRTTTNVAVGTSTTSSGGSTYTASSSTWSLYLGTTNLGTKRSEQVCIADAEAEGDGNYKCNTMTKIVVSTSSTTPVDCVVSSWSAWTPGPTAGNETRTRTVVTAAANGGDACPALSETRAISSTLGLTLSTTSITSGQSATLSWSGGVAPCAASSSPSFTGWGGTVSTAASKSVAPPATTILTLKCANGTLSRTLSVATTTGTNVTALPTPLTRTLAPISSSALDVAILNFSHTANREWDYGGHNVPNTFSTSYGYWDYSNTYIAAWLFDRATTWYRLYELTKNPAHREYAIRDTAAYAGKIDTAGYYIPKVLQGDKDTKYGYVTPFLLYERLTGDTKYRPVAQRIYQASLKGFSSTYNPSSSFWTEREAGIHGEAALSYYEITKDQTALNRAGAIIKMVGALAAANGGAPQVPYWQHEGGGGSGLTNSPWMSALYYQFARRYYEVTGDQTVLQQVSAYFDWLDVNGLYDGGRIGAGLAGVTVPRYLTGALVGDAVYSDSNIMHCLDVAGIVAFAVDAKRKLGLSTTKAQQRLDELEACAVKNFNNWTRSTSTLPKYRISPDRSWNYWMKGRYELLP